LIAWEAFGEANGAATFEVMKARVDRIRARNRMEGATGLEQIGCIVLASPVFFPRERWIPQPADWPPRNLRRCATTSKLAKASESGMSACRCQSYRLRRDHDVLAGSFKARDLNNNRKCR
jgi:putative restriction endonuclease